MTSPFFKTLGLPEIILSCALYASCGLALGQVPPTGSSSRGPGKEPTYQKHPSLTINSAEDLAKLPAGSPLLKEAYSSRGFVDHHPPEPWQKIIDSDILQRPDSADVLCSIIRNPEAPMRIKKNDWHSISVEQWVCGYGRLGKSGHATWKSDRL
jgi:hypothetical protein